MLPLIGLVGGVASGLLGVGGGIFMVPLLVTFAGLSEHEAHATSLLAILPIALVGAAVFSVEGEASYALAALLALGSLVGAPVGARIMARLSEGTLKAVFGAAMIVVAVVLLLP
ncbi:MAG: sulfite exporter TauE/SafE family protein [Actinomycetota bacterium]|nr:sulfite exporter TauE/SafE family protein [Actinomycetota bacterium]